MPKLPHEHDESEDSQAQGRDAAHPAANPPVRDVMREAFDDLEAGRVDTDLHGTPGQPSARPPEGER